MKTIFELKREKVDLHLHTYYSDGIFSPKDVVLYMYNRGIREIAITDHDNIKGVGEAKKISEKLGVIFHSGIEISTEYKGIPMHLLGYDIDVGNVELKNISENLLLKRKLRNEKMIRKLCAEFKIGIDAFNNIEENSYIGKPQMARVLVEQGIADNFQCAFDDILERDEYKKIKKEKISTEKAIEIVKNASGKAVLAHPGLIRNIGERETKEFFNNVNKIIVELKDMGLDGIEAIYRKHSELEEKSFIDIAIKNNLYITKGSDYHGD